jgi:DNA-binding XRE family transcriptional regulator
MQLAFPWFFRKPPNQPHAELLRIRAAQLKGWEYSPHLDHSRTLYAVCDVVLNEFKNSCCPIAVQAQIVETTVDLAVQLGVIEPTRPVKNKPVLIIRTKTFSQKQIGELRASLHSYVQKHINLDDPKPNWELVRVEAEERYRKAFSLEQEADQVQMSKHEHRETAPSATSDRVLPLSADDQAGLAPHQSRVRTLTQGEFIESLRMRLGWSRAKLVTKSGLDPKTIVNAESNKFVADKTIDILLQTFNREPGILPKLDNSQVPRVPAQPRRPRKPKLPKDS